ncbi:MAG: TlpA family protein disulfide reductase [Thiobacillaceae bacterium]
MRAQYYVVGLAAAIALTGGILVSTRLHAPGLDHAASASRGETILAAAFPDLNGERQPLSQWRGKVLVLNFWATWCPPCRQEIPGFMKLQRELADSGVQFVGIALDQADNVNNFARQLGINYPLLLGGDAAFELQSRLGNRSGGLPFTVVVNAMGRPVGRHVGALSAEQLRALLPIVVANSPGSQLREPPLGSTPRVPKNAIYR